MRGRRHLGRLARSCRPCLLWRRLGLLLNLLPGGLGLLPGGLGLLPGGLGLLPGGLGLLRRRRASRIAHYHHAFMTFDRAEAGGDAAVRRAGFAGPAPFAAGGAHMLPTQGIAAGSQLGASGHFMAARRGTPRRPAGLRQLPIAPAPPSPGLPRPWAHGQAVVDRAPPAAPPSPGLRRPWAHGGTGGRPARADRLWRLWWPWWLWWLWFCAGSAPGWFE